MSTFIFFQFTPLLPSPLVLRPRLLLPKSPIPLVLWSAPVLIPLPPSTSVMQPALTTTSDLSSLPTVTGIFNTDASCGYRQGIFSSALTTLISRLARTGNTVSKCGPSNSSNRTCVANQISQTSKPSTFQQTTPPNQQRCLSVRCRCNMLPHLRGLWRPLRSHNLDPRQPIDNAICSCLDDSGNAIISGAAANFATHCRKVCQPGFGMTSAGECVNILMDSTNCGHIVFACLFGYTGYYAQATGCV